MRVPGQFPQILAPGRDQAGGDGGLGDVVEHEALVRERGDEPHGDRQVLREKQQVVGQAVVAQPGKAALESVPQHEPIVWFVVHDMPHPHQFRSGRQLGQLRRQVR